MITVKEFPNRQFATIQELHKALSENKELLKSQKKLQTKFTDTIAYSFAVNEKNEAVKSESINIDEVNVLRIKVVINTCNYFDSHYDVSLNGSWNRTVKNTKRTLLLDSHKYQFESIISDEVELKVETFNWSELGYDYKGTTEALVFYCTIRKERNPFMFTQYARGYVKEHSGGLRYVTLDMAINSEVEWNKEEKEVWDKYYPMIANKEDVDEYGFFWAVSEQKIIEGSAVVFGSNPITPTLSVEPVTDTSTKSDPSIDTPALDLEKFKNYLNIKNN